jgi:outer membrane protein OmpA-like peptidoglycan-associated protein
MTSGSQIGKRSLLCLSALLLCGAYERAAFAQTAQDSSVQTYVNQAVPEATPEGLPQGVEWNHPLKAGTLTLTKPLKPQKPASAALTAPKVSATGTTKLPVGDVQAPRLNVSDDNASMPSSANVMLMQGMKNALQQSGQKLSPPQLGGTAASDIAVEPAGAATSLTPTAPVVSSDVKYESGQEPRSLAAPTASLATTASVDDEKPVVVEGAGEAAASAPVPAAEQSFFGPAVTETHDDSKPVPAEAAAPACEPAVTPWTKSCKDAGYPADYKGQITGETRVECPSGDARDVWLSNSCAPKGGVAKKGAPKATDLAVPPASMADAAKGAPVPATVVETPHVAPVPDASPTEPVVIQGAGASVSSAPMATAAPDPNARLDASCGAANGLAAATKPAGDLCAAGDPTEVLGQGPWRWSCRGVHGGMTVSCAATVASSTPAANATAKALAAKAAPAAEDGKCGKADGEGTTVAPSQDLCAHGLAGRVNGTGPWTWACSGTNGGQAAACSAPQRVEGACGPAAEEGSDKRPERGLCAAGFASAVTGEGPWNWTCSGLHGGGAATCTASPKINAVCGGAAAGGHREAPHESLCVMGTPSTVTGEGPWSWTCAGEHGGANVTCKAAVSQDGACGVAHGGTFDKTPDEDLCATGPASRVTGLGPWSWTCGGLDGGNAASCTASLGAKETAAVAIACGSAAGQNRASAPSAPSELCAGGKSSALTGAGPWSWSCSDENGHNVGCTTLSAIDGTCGAAHGVASPTAPAARLCAAGVPSGVTTDNEHKNWLWQCNGSVGAAQATCSAPVVALATDQPTCGAAARHSHTSAPSSDLCADGKASAVRGSGPWNWTCAFKKTKVSCEAAKQIEGVCGTANGSIQKEIPATGLCASGTATAIEGTGPWMWSCVGLGGGNSASCSASAQAQTKVDGACGAAANAVSTTAPDVNLCDSGVPSQVYGEGPWTWTCSGLNSGIAATCTTSRTVPKAPPPPGPSVNGVCGAANGVAVESEPAEGLCSSGTTTNVSGNGPWNWSCLGANGGMTVSCTAPLMPPPPVVGQCGSSHGVTTLTTPRSGLCSAGIASAVSGKGPWTWSCSGTNGGAAVSCVAPLAGGSSTAPLPSVAASSGSYGDEAPAPSAAPAGLVTPRLTTKKLSPMKAGSVPTLKPSKTLDLPKEASALPPAPVVDDAGLQPPASAPSLPADLEPLTPPPVRDTLAPSASLKPPAIDVEGNKVIAGNKLQLDPEVSTLAFTRGSENIDKDAVGVLDRLAKVLSNHSNVRVTLTAYAAADGTTTPRDARRLSLNRALAVRDYLTTKGVSSGRIDVRALGANVPSGDMDRVDVKVN